jgi:hypothetical protein
MAVSIDSELRDVEFFVPNDALDGRARLALIVEDQGLGMEDPPAISNVRIESHRGSPPTRVEPSLPDTLGGLEAHHVRRGQVRTAPRARDGVAMHECEHGATGLGEPSFVGSPAHRLPDGGAGHLWNHARGLGSRKRRTMGQYPCVDHQQFMG